MKRFLIALALLFLPSLAFAQCNGVFAAGVVCGTATGVPGIPGQVPFASIVQPNSITNSLLSQMAPNTVKCNPTGGTANAQDCPGIPVVTNSITNSLLAQMPANTVKCNPTAATANAQDCPGIAVRCTTMAPRPNQAAGTAWIVTDVYGNAITTSGTTTQGLQEAINYAVNNGQCLEVDGQSNLQISVQNGTLSSASLTITGLTCTTNCAVPIAVGDYVTSSIAGVPGFNKITSIPGTTSVIVTFLPTVNATQSLIFTRGAGAILNTQISANSALTIPPIQQNSLTFRNVNLTFASSINGPGLTINSCIIGDISFIGGQIVYQPAAAGANSRAVLLNPTIQTPLDGVLAIAGCRINLGTIAAPAASGTNADIVGLNCGTGSIVNNIITGVEWNGTGTGVTPNTQNGLSLFGATATTSCAQNFFDVPDIHLVSVLGVSDGNSATQQTHYNGNIYKVNVRPGLGTVCFATWGTGSQWTGTCSNEEASGNINVLLTLQAGSVGFVCNVHSNGTPGVTYINGTGTLGYCNIDGKLFYGGGTAGTILTNGGSSATQATWSVPSRLRFCSVGVNFNAGTTDTALSISPLPTTRYTIGNVRIGNASASISTATVGVFTAAGGGGQTIAANQAITVTATATDTVNNTMALTLTNGNTMAYNDATVQVRVGTAQGSAATADVCVEVLPL